MTGAGEESQPAPEVVALLEGSVFDLAEGLLGFTVSTEIDGAVASLQIDEVEAYAGPDDPASHAYRGRTPRNESMFGPAGTVYVYRSYGIHWCMNIVAGPVDLPHAVLLRGGVPVGGRATIEARRGRSDHLADGPGKLCQALGVTGADDGTSVLSGPIRLAPGAPPQRIETTPRIGISVATGRAWRFVAEHGPG